MQTSALLKKRALEIGFDLVGIAPAAALPDLEFSRQWVEKGFAGEMHYLENPKRRDPRLILPSAKTVVCVVLIYNAPMPYSTEVRSQGSEVGRESSVVSGQSSVKTAPDPKGQAKDKSEAETNSTQPNNSSFEFRVSNFDSPFSNFHFPTSAPRAWISRYAWGRDYHEVMRAKLEELRQAMEALAPGVETRVFVDTGPLVERAFARLSGIGWMGKNTCLINQQKGSWFFLGVLLTNLELAPDMPAPDRCGSCTACLDACPTGALVEPYVMDASRCIAYFTIELKGSIPAEFRAPIGANIFGCDICQDVCPWNGRRGQETQVRSQNEDPPLSLASSPLQAPGDQSSGARGVATTSVPEFLPLIVEAQRQPSSPTQRTNDQGQRTTSRQSTPGPNLRESPVPSPQPPRPATFSLFHPPLEALAEISEDDFRRLFARSPIKRAKYRGWLRNLCVAMGNSGDRRFIPRLQELSQHADPVIREHATWALKRLLGGEV